MTRSARLLFLVFPLALGLLSSVLPGRAQQVPVSRFAFADTTLLRDTLGLTFEKLFPLADSLGMNPVDLRSLAIRYRYSPMRLVTLSDSLHVVVDSVGPVMLRERYNPLATATRKRSNTFSYQSSYGIGRNSSNWDNQVDYALRGGKVSLTNGTHTTMNRYLGGGITRLQQTRTSDTEASWVFSRNLSVGGLASLNLYDAAPEVDHVGRYGLSIRTRQQALRGLTSSLNLVTGLIDQTGTTQEKRGVDGDLNGQARYVRGNWLTNDLSAGFTGNFAHTRSPGASIFAHTSDHSGRLTGTLGVNANAPVGLNVGYNWRTSVTEQPAVVAGAPADSIQRILSGGSGIDMTLRLRQDNDRTLSVTQRISNAQSAIAASPTSQNSSNNNTFTVTGRYRALDGTFGRTLSTTEYPKRGGPNGGYGENVDGRSVSGTFNFDPAARLHGTLTGDVSLSRFRYFLIGTYANPLVPRDSYEQSYKGTMRYTQSRDFSTTIGLEVTRSLFVNIPAASTAANSETRSYRASWSWNFRLLPGLTANQTNQAAADYTYYTFLPPTSDRLVLNYSSHTVLSADITPRLHLDVTHDRNTQPTGGYAPLDPPLNDGNSYFSQSDQNSLSSLRAGLTYSPSQAISITITPDYSSTNRQGVTNGVLVPQRTGKTLNFSGTASLNVPVGRRGQLTGSMTRISNASRNTNYVSGVAQYEPRVVTDYWNGSLQLSWAL